MYDYRSKDLNRSLFFLDTFLTVAMFLAAFQVRNLLSLGEGELDIFSHLFLLPLLITLIVFFLTYFGGYQNPRTATVFVYTWAVLRCMALTIGVVLSLLFFLEIQYVSRIVILLFAILNFIALLVSRLALRSYAIRSRHADSSKLKVMIIGIGERAKEMVRALHNQEDVLVDVLGHLDTDPKHVGTKIDGVPVIGTIDNISECLKKNVVDEVIIAIPRSMLHNADHIAQACEEEGIKLRFMADLFNVRMARVSLTRISDIPLLTMESVAHDEDKLFVKRLFDLTLTILAMPLALPVMVLIALAIKLDSPGPVFFVQQRVGLRKHLFPMYKFRSMQVDAEEKIDELEHLNEAEGPIFKIANDPRVTRVGRFLRKTSLDELPQLFNVLRGEMSLVGPRPMSIRDVDLFDKGIQRKRFSVMPGITCIWQISGRSNLPFEKWLELDLEYIEKWSLRLDLKILVKTIPAVLRSKGAV